MFTQLIWWSSIFLIGALLVRAIAGKYLTRYSLFYTYLGWVVLSSLLCFYAYAFRPSSYASVYWYTQFGSVALGYCVIWEIYTQVLADYPGVARMARTVLLAFFVAVMAKTLAHQVSSRIVVPAEIPAVLERDLRAVQAILLVVIVGLLIHYGIPIGRNLRGMILGYGLFIGVSVTSLALRFSIGKPFQPWWQYLQPVAYDLTLVIWCATLWSYQPNPQPERHIGIEADYDLAAERTAKAIARAWGYLAGVGRP